MLIQRDATHRKHSPRGLQTLEASHWTSLYEVEMELLGSERQPMQLAIASVASALIVLATTPLTSPVAFAAVSLFLAFAAYLVLVTDGELARRGAAELRIDQAEESPAPMFLSE